ncbi:MAG: hypothetical protein K2M43_01675, partial [Mycoplasmoidaceae bacterium]|nr:hypothetical protein [Mycoplasmoidaceae bacterium]
LDLIKNNGHAIIEKEANQDILDCLGVTYQIISNVEGLSCYSSFTGIPFGENLGGKDYKDILTKNRSAFINSQVKRRLIYGIYVSSSDNFDKIYIKAKKIRTLLINLANDLLDGVDCLLIPSSSCIAPKIDDALNNRCKSTHADDALDLANFAGLPSITIPAGKYNNMPYGININCKQFKDQDVLNIAYTIEDILGGNNE